MSKLYFLIGLARGGKSTFSKKWQTGDITIINNNHTISIGQMLCSYNIPQQSSCRVVLSLDSFRLASSGKRYNGFAEGNVFLSSSIAAKSLLLSDYDVLLDDTHTTEESIRRVFRICPHAIYYKLDVAPSICIQRAIDSNQPDLQWVIERQMKNLENLTNERIEQIRLEILNDRSANYITHD